MYSGYLAISIVAVMLLSDIKVTMYCISPVTHCYQEPLSTTGGTQYKLICVAVGHGIVFKPEPHCTPENISRHTDVRHRWCTMVFDKCNSNPPVALVHL